MGFPALGVDLHFAWVRFAEIDVFYRPASGLGISGGASNPGLASWAKYLCPFGTAMPLHAIYPGRFSAT